MVKDLLKQVWDSSPEKYSHALYTLKIMLSLTFPDTCLLAALKFSIKIFSLNIVKRDKWLNKKSHKKQYIGGTAKAHQMEIHEKEVTKKYKERYMWEG